MKKSKYCFFDVRRISKSENTEYRLGKIKKYATDADWADQYGKHSQKQPDWEQRVSILYPHVEYKDGIYRLWYHTWYTKSPTAKYDWRDYLIDAKNANRFMSKAKAAPKGVCYEAQHLLCYMESTDGVCWTRPDCGEFYYKKQSGEIVGTNIVYVGNHGCGVTENDNPDLSEPRYLMAFKALDTGKDRHGVAISWSDDGIHWSEPVTVRSGDTCADKNTHMHADAQNQIFWSKALGRYVILTRGHTDGLRNVIQMTATDQLKSIRDMKTVKDNFGDRYWDETAKYWSAPEVVIPAKLSAQPYTIPAAQISKEYMISPVSILNFDTDDKNCYRVCAQLAWSEDSIHWHFICPGEAFIKNSETFNFTRGNDYGMIYCAAPIEIGDKVHIFYAATPEMHYVRYEDIPDFMRQVIDKKIPAAAEAKTFTRSTSLCHAVIKKDRYAGLYSEDGNVETAAFTVTGSSLNITADASGGSVVLSLADEHGNAIDGYGESDFLPICRNVTEKSVTWNKKNLSDFIGRRVTLKVKLKNASVYSMSGDFEF